MFEWIKKHKIIVIISSIILIFGIPLIIHVLFKIHAGIPFLEAEWSAGEILGYYGSILSFIGTVVLGVLALYQNRLIKEESDKRALILEQREHERNMPKFTVESKGSNGNCAHLHFVMSNISDNLSTEKNYPIYTSFHLMEKFIGKASENILLCLFPPMVLRK